MIHDDRQGQADLLSPTGTNKVEPNEDATSATATSRPPPPPATSPIPVPFIYPNVGASTARPMPRPAAANGFLAGSAAHRRRATTSPTASAPLQRTDRAGLPAKYDYKINAGHHLVQPGLLPLQLRSRGIVAGPINQAGLPGLFATYYPGPGGGRIVHQRRLAGRTSPTCSAARATKCAPPNTASTAKARCRTLNWHLGDHQIEAGHLVRAQRPGFPAPRLVPLLRRPTTTCRPMSVPSNPKVFDPVLFPVPRG